MKKLRILALILCAALVGAVLSGCAQKEEMPTIAILQFADHPSLDNCREGFMEGLRLSGYEEGENITFAYQNAQADTAVANQIATNFVSKKVAMICGIATPAAQAAFNAAEPTGIPVVYSAISDPVEAKFADAQGHTSGRNITGTSDRLPVEQQLIMIRAFLPEATKIGILYSTNEINSITHIAEYKELAPKYGFEIVEKGIGAAQDLPMALDVLLNEVDCLNNLTDNLVVSALATVLDKAGEKNIPVFGSEIEQVKNGCLAAQSLDYYALGVETGKLAARVLDGEKIGDMPFISIEESSPVINQRVMEQLALNLPEVYANTAEFVVE